MLRVLLVLLVFPVLVIGAAEEVDEDPFNVDFFCGWGVTIDRWSGRRLKSE